MDIPSDLLDRAGILIDDAQMHIEHLVRGIPASMAATTLRGEGADHRVRLVVQLSGLLEQIRDAALAPSPTPEEMAAANRDFLEKRSTAESRKKVAELFTVVQSLPDYSADVEWVPPMWALWLIDPSGKYGPHKYFAEHGETIDDAYASALARYQPAGRPATRDTTRKPRMINPGHKACSVCRRWDGDHNEERHASGSKQ